MEEIQIGRLQADRIGGIIRTLFCSMAVQVLALVLLSSVLGWVTGIIIFLVVWEITVWTFGPTQNFNLVSLAPEASSIVLSLNSSFVQLRFAAAIAVLSLSRGHCVVRSER